MNIAHGQEIKKIDLPTKESPREVYFYGSANLIGCCHADSVLRSVGLKAIEGPELYEAPLNFKIIRAKVIPIDDKTDLRKVSLLEMKASFFDLVLLSEEDLRDNVFPIIKSGGPYWTSGDYEDAYLEERVDLFDAGDIPEDVDDTCYD